LEFANPTRYPGETIEDKVHFIFNNISAQNLEAKGKELVNLIREEFYPWLAQYFVIKRVAIEPNFHQLYLSFFEKINIALLGKIF